MYVYIYIYIYIYIYMCVYMNIYIYTSPSRQRASTAQRCVSIPVYLSVLEYIHHSGSVFFEEPSSLLVRPRLSLSFDKML